MRAARETRDDPEAGSLRYKKILVLGGTGKTGRLLINEALDRGHEVTALIRPERRLPAWEGLTVVKGDVLDFETVLNAALGHDAIISCLGISRENPANPWSKTLSPPGFLTRAARVMAAAAGWAGIRRVLAISAAGAGDSYHMVDTPTRMFFSLSPFGQVVADSEKMEEVLRESPLDWLVARPVRLIDGPPTGRASALRASGLGDTVRRADLARWLLDMLERPGTYQPHAEVVGWA